MSLILRVVFLLLFTSSMAYAGVFGDSEIFDSAENNDITSVEKYLLNGENPNIRSKAKIPLISKAAAAGSTGVVKTLLDHGANSNLDDRNGNTDRKSVV